MKYIRTKNGIYDTEGSKRVNNVKACFIGNAVIYDDEIISQADTIEELSDYVIRKPSGSVDDRPFILKYIIHKGYLNRNNYEEIREELKKQYEMQKKGDKAIIYLAIATDKGLIYVAKMNEKGELELL